MIGALARFLRLPLPDQTATIEAFAQVVMVRARLKMLPQAAASEWVNPMLNPPQPDERVKPTETGIAVQRIRSAVQRASRRVPGATCLVQAIAAHRMLRSLGVPSRIRIGVEKAEGNFAAHAWLTVDDKIVLGGADASARFVELRRS